MILLYKLFVWSLSAILLAITAGGRHVWGGCACVSVCVCDGIGVRELRMSKPTENATAARHVFELNQYCSVPLISL